MLAFVEKQGKYGIIIIYSREGKLWAFGKEKKMIMMLTKF